MARIAPRPSHLHLSAAIALSELSAKRYLVDVGIQVRDLFSGNPLGGLNTQFKVLADTRGGSKIVG